MVERLEPLHVRWQVSWYDTRHGVARDVAPHVVAAGVAASWTLAPLAGGAGALAWLGGAVLVVQVALVARALARRHRHWRAAERVLTVRGSSFVLLDETGPTVYDAPIVGVVDDRGVLQIDFADGSTLEAPWRAFTNAALRQLRRHLRVRLGASDDLDHVPVRRVGVVSGAAAWRRPWLALLGAVVLAALPWLLPS